MRRSERGSITVMTIGFLVVIALLLTVVVNASVAYLDRQKLADLADGAALAAADGLDEGQYYADQTIRLDAREARRLVSGYLESRAAGRPDVEVHVEGDSVRVWLERIVDLPFTPLGWGENTRVSVEASAQLRRP